MASVPLADLHVHLPDDPRAGELPHDERGQEVRDELLLAEATDRGLARDLDPEREHDERHVRREHPDDELAAVRDRRDEPDAEQRRRRPQSAHVLCSRATASFAFR